MQLVDKFHNMESECLLFDIGKDIDLPIWDIIRYQVYLKYYYSESDRKRLEQAPVKMFSDYLYLFTSILSFFLRICFVKGTYIVFSASRYKNEKNQYFDKSVLHIIEELKGKGLVIEPILGKKMAYTYFYDFSNLLRRLNKGSILPKDDFQLISNALTDYLGDCRVTYEELNISLLNFKSDCHFYEWLFTFKHTKKIIIATGNPKAQILAAKKLNISSYLVQHASIEFDEIDYSYPYNVTSDSRILLPDTALTFGEYWCKGLNFPVNIISTGNDFFYNIPLTDSDNSILVVSTVVHGDELKLLTRELAQLRPELNFIYKLHPNEFQYYKDYLEFFKNNKNVKIIVDSVDTNILISRSDLVILIVSAVLYEALNQNKKVAIYKKINFERQLGLAKLPNVYLFSTKEEIIDIIKKDTVINELDFYKPLDQKLMRRILEI